MPLILRDKAMIKPSFKIKTIYGQIVEGLPNIDLIALKAKLVAIQNAPEKTGYLKNSIYTRTGKTFFELGATAPYAPYQEEGVDPFVMSLKNGKPFARIPIMTPQGLVFRTLTPKSVWKHSGIKGKHFIRKGIEAVEDEFFKYACEGILTELIRSIRMGIVREIVKEVK